MRFDKGWVKVWRIDDEHWLAKDPLSLFLWWRLISIANYKPSRLRTGKEIIELPPGTIVTSRSELAERVGRSDKVVRRALDGFEKDQMIVQQKSSKGTIITICNWDKYQSSENVEVQQKSSEKSSEGPARVQRGSSEGPLSEEDKKERNKEEDTIPSLQTSPEPSVHGNDDYVINIKTEVKKIDYEGFIAIWNKHRGQLPACTKIGESRKRKIKSRLAEEPDLNYWIDAIQNLASSRFIIESKWCDFNWLIDNDNNHRKASSGKYNQKTQSQVNDFDYIYGKKE